MSYLKHINVPLFFLLITLPLCLSLQVGFYSKTCPNAEKIVQKAIQQKFSKDKTVTAALLRMHFHDCFVQGCDASLLIDSTKKHTSEKAAGANLSIREFTLIDTIKSSLEAACPQNVSCSDIIALATRDAVALAGGPKYTVPTGRRDGLVSKLSDVNLPGPASTVSQALNSFRAQNMDLADMIVLLGGGHTVGDAHCGFFRDRLSNFQGTGAPDKTMDKSLLRKLQGLCANSNTDPTTSLDQNTTTTFDNEYFNQIGKKRGILQIDQELALDPMSSQAVLNLARNKKLFEQRFVQAITKMGKIKVLEGSAGEIRKNCRVFNKKKK